MHAVLFERALVEAGCRFDERLDRYEDWDFWLQLAEQDQFLHVDQITACYRNFGHSGFGLDADVTKIAAGRAALFDKWRQRWTGGGVERGAGGITGRRHSPASTTSLNRIAAGDAERPAERTGGLAAGDAGAVDADRQQRATPSRKISDNWLN